MLARSRLLLLIAIQKKVFSQCVANFDSWLHLVISAIYGLITTRSRVGICCMFMFAPKSEFVLRNPSLFNVVIRTRHLLPFVDK